MWAIGLKAQLERSADLLDEATFLRGGVFAEEVAKMNQLGH